MSTPRIVSFRIAPEKITELDLMAKALDRDRSYLINQAVENYLNEQRQFSEAVEQGRKDIRRGRSYTTEQVEEMMSEWERAGR